MVGDKKPKYLIKKVKFKDSELTLYSIDGHTWSSRKDELVEIKERHENQRSSFTMGKDSSSKRFGSSGAKKEPGADSKDAETDEAPASKGKPTSKPAQAKNKIPAANPQKAIAKTAPAKKSAAKATSPKKAAAPSKSAAKKKAPSKPKSTKAKKK